MTTPRASALLLLALATIAHPAASNAQTVKPAVHLTEHGPASFHIVAGPPVSDGEVFETQGRTAEMIVAESVLITAAGPARIRVSHPRAGSLQVSPLSGHMRLLVGGNPVQVVLPGGEITLKNTEAYLVKAGEEYLVLPEYEPAALEIKHLFPPLVPPRPPGRLVAGPPALSPPRNDIRTQASEHDALADIEIEELEIEADCLEICVE